MNDSDRQLISDALLGNTSEEDAAKLGAKLETSAEFRERFLDQLDVEAFLHAEAKAGAFAEDPQAFFEQLEDESESPKIVPFTRSPVRGLIIPA